VESCAFRTVASRKIQTLCDFRSRFGDTRPIQPRSKMMVCADAEHITVASAPQGHFDFADAVNAVSRDRIVVLSPDQAPTAIIGCP